MNAPRLRADAPADDRRETISALADGDPAALERACALWRDDAHARATWHSYHLIGDVLRSDDLASSPARDAAFLAALRERLAAEPVIVAPLAAVSPRRRQGWLLPMAAAAGFVAVAGVLVVVRMGAPDGATPPVAGVPAPAASVTLAGSGGGAPSVPVYSGQMIRDPHLDRYLQAHRAALVGGAVAVPGGVPRSVDGLSSVTPTAAPVAR
jgi:sigma-E factor negative regulatory protein RseA